MIGPSKYAHDKGKKGQGRKRYRQGEGQEVTEAVRTGVTGRVKERIIDEGKGV